MEGKKTETKEIMEVKDGKVETKPDDKKTVELSRTYKFDGEEISTLHFSGLEDFRARDMIRVNNIMMDNGTNVVIPENTLYFALIVASDTTGLPLEFFMQLIPRDAMSVRRFVSNYFFAEG